MQGKLASGKRTPHPGRRTAVLLPSSRVGTHGARASLPLKCLRKRQIEWTVLCSWVGRTRNSSGTHQIPQRPEFTINNSPWVGAAMHCARRTHEQLQGILKVLHI